MKNQLPVDPDSVIAVATIIGRCDFRVTVSRYIPREKSPWVITVGESVWQRHLVVDQIDEDGTDATLRILAPAQSEKFGYNIDIQDVERRITLRELIANTYTSVKEALKPKGVAA